MPIKSTDINKSTKQGFNKNDLSLISLINVHMPIKCTDIDKSIKQELNKILFK